MNQIVVDTDVASHIFNWHSLGDYYVNALRRVRVDPVLHDNGGVANGRDLGRLG